MNFQTILEELDKLYEENLTNDVDTEEEVQESLVEDADEEVLIDDEPIVDDEAQEEEPEVEAEENEAPKQVVLECSNCGALVIKADSDIAVDESTDLVNIDEECQFCEEAEGYKIIGTLAPYEEAEDINEGLFGKKVEKTVKASELKKGDVVVGAMLGGKFDKYAKPTRIKKIETESDGYVKISLTDGSLSTAGNTEVTILTKPDKTTEDCKSDKDLDELFDANVTLDARGFGGSGNDVSVLGV